MIDAAASADGLRPALNVGAMLIAFVSLIALVNLLLDSLGGLFGFDELSLQLVLGYLFAPVALVIGVPWGEVLDAGNCIGQKITLNEFVAYSNFGTLAILIGGGLAPSRRGQIAQFGIRALIAGTLANLLNAAIAGMLVG